MSIYGKYAGISHESWILLHAANQGIDARNIAHNTGKSYEHLEGRVKGESMTQKCERKRLPLTPESLIENRDAIGTQNRLQLY